MGLRLAEIAKNPSDKTKLLFTPNQIASWNLRRLRAQSEMTQERLGELMTHFGISWSTFTVSDAELAVRDPDKGRRFTADELALLSLVFYVTPGDLLIPPSRSDIENADIELAIKVGDVVMSRETYLTDVLLRPSGIAARSATGSLDDRLS